MTLHGGYPALPCTHLPARIDCESVAATETVCTTLHSFTAPSPSGLDFLQLTHHEKRITRRGCLGATCLSLSPDTVNPFTALHAPCVLWDLYIHSVTVALCPCALTYTRSGNDERHIVTRLRTTFNLTEIQAAKLHKPMQLQKHIAHALMMKPWHGKASSTGWRPADAAAADEVRSYLWVIMVLMF